MKIVAYTPQERGVWFIKRSTRVVPQEIKLS